MRQLSDILSDRRAEGFERYREIAGITARETPPDLAKSVRMIEMMTVATTEGGNEMGGDPEATLIAAHAAGVAIALMVVQAFHRTGWGFLSVAVQREFEGGLMTTIRKIEEMNPARQPKETAP